MINPMQSLSDFQNKVLTPTTQRSQGTTTPDQAITQTSAPLSSPPATIAGAEPLSGMAEIGQRATGAHNTIMQSIQRKRQQQLWNSGHGTGGGATIQAQRSGAGLGSAGGWGGAYGLQKNAAAALARMNAAYQQRWGSGLVVNSGGRSYAEQARAYVAYLAGRGNLAAKPGTSVHETGRAVDLGGPLTNMNSAQHAWLRQVAAQYGWSWTGRNFSQVEPWHWEYVGS